MSIYLFAELQPFHLHFTFLNHGRQNMNQLLTKPVPSKTTVATETKPEPLSIGEFFRSIGLQTDVERYGKAHAPRQLRNQTINAGKQELALLLAHTGLLRLLTEDYAEQKERRFDLTELQLEAAKRGCEECMSRDAYLGTGVGVLLQVSCVEILPRKFLERIAKNLVSIEAFAVRHYGSPIGAGNKQHGERPARRKR